MASPVQLAPISHGSRRATVVRQILLGICDGRFPSGQRLVVQRLAERFGVSPTPVREALVELAGVGMVELSPNRGAVVRPFGTRQVREICQLRRLLEAEAARCACGRAPAEELAELEGELVWLTSATTRNEVWLRRTREADHRLHVLVAVHCGSVRLAEEIGRYVTLFRTLREAHDARMASSNRYSEMDENAEHLAIVRALERNDADGAAAAMALHIDNAAGNLAVALFDEQALGAGR